MLKNFWIAKIYDGVDKTKFIHKSDENFPKDSLHVYAENEPAMKRNDVLLNSLSGGFYKIEADDKIPD